VSRLWSFALVLLAVACSAGTAGTADKPPGTGAPVSVPFETVLQTSVPGQAGQQRREAVRDAAAWATLWAELREGSGLPAEPPAVDFNHDMVIAAAMATQSCVSKVTIRTITRSGDGLAVDLLEEPPAPNCICITSARPIHLVKLAKQAGPVHFTAEQGVTHCG
jgi:hypothetical protein